MDTIDVDFPPLKVPFSWSPLEHLIMWLFRKRSPSGYFLFILKGESFGFVEILTIFFSKLF
jgi:hypothetical protein